MRSFTHWLYRVVTEWLVRDSPPSPIPLCDFRRLQHTLRPGDVVLIEGRSRISEVIKLITQSPWSHAALYIGRLCDIDDLGVRARIREYFDGGDDTPLLVEALIDQGTIVTPLHDYRRDHVRICRPAGLSEEDAERVTRYAIEHLGWDYDLRQLIDLARFLFPWHFLPRCWRSSLFQHHVGGPTRTVCSSLLAEAFNSVDYPVLPFIDRDGDGSLRFFKRNPRLFAPRDFDYSPYFNIVKYPYLGVSDMRLYRHLPWDDAAYYNDEREAFEPYATQHAATLAQPANPADSTVETATSDAAEGTISRRRVSGRRT